MWRVVLNHVLLSTFHCPNLTLSLFMLGVFTDHPDHPFSFDDLTLVADFFDRGPDFQGLFLPKNNSSPSEIIGR
jgi:hypothetical protein